MESACWTAEDRAQVLAQVEDGLWRYVARHARAIPVATRLLADLTGLAPSSLDLLRHLHLVLDEDVARCIDEALPALLRRLRPVAPRYLGAGRGGIRGQIAWGATTAARARSGGADRALYVTATPRQQYGTAETRLLVRLLRGLAGSCAALEALAPEGASGRLAPGGATESWAVTSARVRGVAQAALSRPGLCAVDVEAATAQADLAACRRSPRVDTRAVAAAYARYRDLVERPTLAALLDALRRRALVPLDDDALYELWALLGAATVFEGAGWTLEDAALAGLAAVPFCYRSPDGRSRARLRFGHTPAHWRRASRYRSVFEHYGLAGGVRRPDLIVEVQRGGRRRHLLVEVKRTRDAQYVADSIYKVLGYLADFESVYKGQDGPRALLLLWERPGGAPVDVPAAPGMLVVATHADYHACLAALVTILSGSPF